MALFRLTRGLSYRFKAPSGNSYLFTRGHDRFCGVDADIEAMRKDSALEEVREENKAVSKSEKMAELLPEPGKTETPEEPTPLKKKRGPAKKNKKSTS